MGIVGQSGAKAGGWGGVGDCYAVRVGIVMGFRWGIDGAVFGIDPEPKCIAMKIALHRAGLADCNEERQFALGDVRAERRAWWGTNGFRT